ncbi:hypothetical protein [Streptosporangium subroseum]|uniref:hypothetical protein n=1 Tax=Streptosporangium subroseum TaxID=106412 RepID=UPI00118100D4|nr:hypothetical protein [Streptosporangium subroseum]
MRTDRAAKQESGPPKDARCHVQGHPVVSAARGLNNWMHMDRLAAQHGSGDETTAPAESEQEELARLRREKTDLSAPH